MRTSDLKLILLLVLFLALLALVTAILIGPQLRPIYM